MDVTEKVKQGIFVLKNSRQMKNLYLDPEEIRFRIFKSMINEFPELKSLLLLSSIRNNSRDHYRAQTRERSIHKSSRLKSKPVINNKSNEITPLWAKLKLSMVNKPSR
jgi:hypothetical protein